MLAAQDLLCFFSALALFDCPSLRTAEPKTMRYRLLHVAGRLTDHARRLTLRLDRSWPWAHTLVVAFTRIRTLPPLA